MMEFVKRFYEFLVVSNASKYAKSENTRMSFTPRNLPFS